MVPVGGCALVEVPVAVPVVWPVFPGVGPEPASCALADFPVISHGPAWAVPTLRAITAQPARMSCFTYICHSLVCSFRACLRRTEAYDKPTHEPRVPSEGDWLMILCGG